MFDQTHYILINPFSNNNRFKTGVHFHFKREPLKVMYMACKRFIFFYVEQACLFIMNNQIIKHTEQCRVYKQIALLKAFS